MEFVRIRRLKVLEKIESLENEDISLFVIRKKRILVALVHNIVFIEINSVQTRDSVRLWFAIQHVGLFLEMQCSAKKNIAKIRASKIRMIRKRRCCTRDMVLL